MTVRVRFAPSPTGIPHVGNIRTALFNWLFARHEGGSFVLRIEDTDQTRLVPGALDAIIDSLRWLGLDWDEGPEVDGPYGPYHQSQRLEHYRRAAEGLIAKDAAYRCYCSPERLQQVRAEQTRRKEPPRYDRCCRNLSEDERLAQAGVARLTGVTPVVRFKTPLSGRTEFDDIVRGHVVFENETLDDFIIVKSDGFPTYHLANVVDDHLMEITHVLRAEEWLPSTPRHLLLYDALGYAAPQFVHLPMILGSDRAKLSKRHGAVSLLEYRRQGYLPEAMFNFLSLLGWSLDDRTEIISREEFIRYFSLERIVKNPAIFDVEKLTWMNGVYLRMKNDRDLAETIRDEVRQEGELEKERLFSPDVASAARRIALEIERKHTQALRQQIHSFDQMLREQQRATSDFLVHGAWLLDRARKEQIQTMLEAWNTQLSQVNFAAINASFSNMRSIVEDSSKQAQQLADTYMRPIVEGSSKQAQQLADTHMDFIASLIKERIKRLTDIVPSTAFFFVEGPLDYTLELLLGKRFAGKPDEARQALESATSRLSAVDRWEHEALEGALRPLAEELGLKAGDLFMLLRVAVTGQTATPPLFETMEVLGRDRCLARLDDALHRLT